MSTPESRAVRAHYAKLAAQYDQRANKACKRAYTALVREKLGGAARVLELGAGSEPIAGVLDAPLKIACDVSLPMLARSSAQRRVVADGAHPPFRGGAFDTVLLINVIEHVADPAAFVAACAEMLEPGGRLLAVTPNGDAAWLLELLERLRLKLPEGPHRFLGRDELTSLSGTHFDVIEHRRWLAFPAGPEALVRCVDQLGPRTGWGLFQYVLMRRR